MQVIANCFVAQDNHRWAGAVQHLETAGNQWINTARDRRRPIVLGSTICWLYSETHSDAFDPTTVLGTHAKPLRGDNPDGHRNLPQRSRRVFHYLTAAVQPS